MLRISRENCVFQGYELKKVYSQNENFENLITILTLIIVLVFLQRQK